PDTFFHKVRSIRRQSHSTPMPVIFVSTRDDLTIRLEAVRAGGDAFLAKPVDIGLLVERLEALIKPREPDPYRILIVEDEPAVAEFYAYVLKEAGMVTRIVTKPLEIMPVLVDFNPDLILMDIYMPECSGVELAKVIRQMEAFVTVPIVFLSGESDVERQLDAMSLAGDDFLMKPILPQHLVKSVRLRVERSRILRQLTLMDGLTGLFNHTAIEERLHKEMERARRQRTGLAFAMIDLDHFREVNDTYGHPVGDRVLRTLSRVLLQNLRRTDIIGRYGGEEFAVILLDTNGHYAARALDNVRRKFSRIKHRTGHLAFQITFSCGVAAFPEHQELAELHTAADQALYEAKQRGRNQTILAEQGQFTPVVP
ncbi:MAG: diguanylate cyclase, partial [Ardenticatenia bacterium]|nr:diguanylate cyclase [Ardenticatenia bacterium]